LVLPRRYPETGEFSQMEDDIVIFVVRGAKLDKSRGISDDCFDEFNDDCSTLSRKLVECINDDECDWISGD
jgi:hypothetical protein